MCVCGGGGGGGGGGGHTVGDYFTAAWRFYNQDTLYHSINPSLRY